MNTKYAPGYTSKGIVIDNGSKYNNPPLGKELCPYGKLIVRVPEFHGFSGNQDALPDSILPAIPYQLAPGQSRDNINEIYPINSIVIVTLPLGSPDNLLVTGLLYSSSEIKNADNLQDNSDSYWSSTVNEATGGYLGSEGGPGDPNYISQTPDYISPISQDYNPIWGTYFGIPTENKSISSPFGKRNLSGSSFHRGVDLSWSGCKNTPVCASGKGKVIYIDNKYTADSGWYDSKTGTYCKDGGGYGNNVVIDHGIINGNHYYTRYAHLNAVKVKLGDTVLGSSKGSDKATVIGDLGHTGSSTGPHLHFEVLKGGTYARDYAVNPEEYINFK